MSTATSPRIEAIDALRGLALALMLLVNNPGSWSAVYGPLLHANWHGLTPTDFVFPFFLFVVGASMACSLRRQIQSSGLPWLQVAKRGTLLFVIGFLLQVLPLDQSPDTWRVLGVLQRIGLCFMAVSVLVALIKERYLLFVGMGLLILYWCLLELASGDPYALQTNLVRQVDMAILGEQHMWQGKGLAFDPEGLLSTLGACITLLWGYLVCAKVLQANQGSKQVSQLLILAVLMIALGCLGSFWHPINKSLWTSTFVLVTSGAACACLALIILLAHTPIAKTLLLGLKIYGSNPIFIYVASWILAIFLNQFTLSTASGDLSINQWIYGNLQDLMADKLASLVYAFGFTLLFYVVALILYKKRIFIKLT